MENCLIIWDKNNKNYDEYLIMKISELTNYYTYSECYNEITNNTFNIILYLVSYTTARKIHELFFQNIMQDSPKFIEFEFTNIAKKLEEIKFELLENEENKKLLNNLHYNDSDYEATVLHLIKLYLHDGYYKEISNRLLKALLCLVAYQISFKQHYLDTTKSIIDFTSTKECEKLEEIIKEFHY